MKRIALTTTILTLSLLSLSAQADNKAQGGFNAPAATTNGGFQGPSAKYVVNTVANALEASDDTKVQLTGKIISSLGDEHYLFRDQTGEIKIEIDHDLWQGRNVTPEMTIMIIGEVDKNWSKSVIDVDRLQIVR